MTTLQHIERAARRRRSGNPLVEDLRLAQGQEIGRTIEATRIPVSEMAA